MIPKFRAWDKKEKRINLIDEIIFSDEYVIMHNGAIREFDEVVIMQSTGLADVNSKEIFEGDILKSPYGFVGKVNIVEGAWYVQHSDFNNNHFLYVAQGKSVVIGNIHEHSHLLEDGGIRE